MELNEMEKKLLFQVEGDYQTKILNELYMTVRYSNNSEQREAAEGLMAKLRVLSNVEQSRIHESRCKVDKFELVITGEDGANGDLSMVAYGKDMNMVRRELKVHISHLCYILCTAAEDYYKNNKEKFDFIKYSIEDDRPKTFL